jgi:hypothetical protein
LNDPETIVVDAIVAEGGSAEVSDSTSVMTTSWHSFWIDAVDSRTERIGSFTPVAAAIVDDDS